MRRLPEFIVLLVLIAAAERPSLSLRGPVGTFTGQSATFTAEVKGPDLEAWYCPREVWDFKDGTVSSHEEDCDPWDSDSKVQRFYVARHVFKTSGQFSVEVSLEKARRVIARRSWTVRVMQAGGSYDDER